MGNFTSCLILKKKAFLRPYQLDLTCFQKIPFRWRSNPSPIVSNVKVGAKLIKPFATANILRAKQVLLPTADEKFFKFSMIICMHCFGKIFIWGHFCSMVELLLNHDLGHFLITEKIFVFLFIESTISWTASLHANIQMPWCTKCNQSNWWQPERFYQPESPLWRLANQSFHSTIYTGPMGGCASMLG